MNIQHFGACPNDGSENAPFAGFDWQNPIHFDQAAGPYGDLLRDPHIIRVGDTYYLTHTGTPSFGMAEYDPYQRRDGSCGGVRVYSTKDFKTWKAESWIVETDALPDDCPYRNQCWAPELHEIGGRYYAVFLANNWKMATQGDCWVAVADKPGGPYGHITTLKGAGCDVTFAEDDDGKVYAFMIGDGIHVQQVDLSGIDHGDIKLVGPVKLALDPKPMVKKGLWQDPWTEGPWVKRRANGKYYLFTAVHLEKKGEDPPVPFQYWMCVSTADHPMGPWTLDDRPGVFFGGHGSVFDGPDGRWWYVYKNEKFEAGGVDYLCIDPMNFLPDGRIEFSEPTPYDIETHIAPDGKVTQIKIAPKPRPIDQRPAPLPSPVLLPVAKCDYPARKLGEWDFQNDADGNPLAEGFLKAGDFSLQNLAGKAFAARAVVFPTGPKLVKEGGKLALDSTEGSLYFPIQPGKATLNSNKNFSVWVRAKPLRTPDKHQQGFVTAVERWKITSSPKGELEVNFGPNLGDVLAGRGPKLENDQWVEIGVTFEGDADPMDLHQDVVTVYLDGKVIGTATGRAMFTNRGSFQIGCDWYNGNNGFEGLIDHVIFWDGIVGAPEMQALSAKAQ